MDLLTNIQRHLAQEFATRYEAGVRKFDFLGGRRSGKTYFILQFLLTRVYLGEVVSVATMTDTQGRLGAYQDAKDIVNGSSLAPWCDILTSPQEIRSKTGGRMFFKSYQQSETAKGIACDWLYINEANNFTEQQYIDLSASVRKGTIADRNPNSECWTERNGFSIIHSTWRDNAENLTEQQREWFEQLKSKAEADNATQADIAFYKMYYLGEYAEITGSIFTPANIRREPIDLQGLTNYFIYADPSAMCGADYFAMVLAAFRGGVMYIVDTHSVNVGSRQDIAEVMQDWCSRYDVHYIFVEGNGLVGKQYYEEQRASLPNMRPYTNSENKHGRILGNYESLCTKVVFNDTPKVREYLAQVYEYEGKNSNKTHDDNIDAVNSAYEIGHRYLRLV